MCTGARQQQIGIISARWCPVGCNLLYQASAAYHVVTARFAT
jgi:hypothetical protein